MSHILKALRKSQMERELGQIPSLQAPYPDETPPTPARRRWWLWVLGVVVVGNLGFIAAYAWQYVIPTDRAAESDSKGQPLSAQVSLDGEPPEVAPLQADIRTSQTVPEAPAQEGTELQDLATVTQALPLIPIETQSGAVTPAATQAVPELEASPEPQPHLSRPLTPEQLPQAAKSPGVGPEKHSFPIVTASDVIPSADPTAPDIDLRAEAAGRTQLATSRVVVPDAWDATPQKPRRRPSGAIWAATVSSARAAAAATSAARNPAPLPAMTASQATSSQAIGAQEVSSPALESQPRATSTPTAAEQQQSAYVTPRMSETLGAVTPQDGVPAPGADTKEVLPRYEQLTKEFRAQIPTVKLSAHVYDPNPQRRFARINKTKFREGDEIVPGLWLEAVTAEGIVLRYDDTRFQMSSF